MEKDIFCGWVFRVTTEVRNGHTFERVYIRPGVSVIPITSDGKIRFVREVPWHSSNVCTKLVTGYVENNEEPLVSAKRELEEELGLTAEKWETYLCAKSEEGAVRKEQYYYLARWLKQCETNPDPNENICGYVDIPLTEIRAMVLRGEFGTASTAFVLLKLTDPSL